MCGESRLHGEGSSYATNLWESENSITGVSVKTPPTKVVYTAGDMLNLTGLIVTLTKSDETTEDVGLANFASRGITVAPSHNTRLATTHDKVTITVNGKTAEQEIEVIPRDLSTIIPTDILAGGTITGAFGSGSVKIIFYHHHKSNAAWGDNFEIQGALYSNYGISAKLNRVPGQDFFDREVSNYLPGWSSPVNVGVNTGKKPQFTITFYDNYGSTITTGVFMVTDTDGTALK